MSIRRPTKVEELFQYVLTQMIQARMKILVNVKSKA